MDQIMKDFMDLVHLDKSPTIEWFYDKTSTQVRASEPQRFYNKNYGFILKKRLHGIC